MTPKFNTLHESLMGKIRQMTGMGGFNKLKEEWLKLKNEALKIIGARSNEWRLILTPTGQNLNYTVGPRGSLDYGPEQLKKLREIKTRLDEIRKEVIALGIPWYKVDGTL